MKIKLPNPDDYLHKEHQFWEQLELSIYHAKKAWEKVLATYAPEQDEEYPWLSFSHEQAIEDALDSAAVDKDYKERQEIAIEINEL